MQLGNCSRPFESFARLKCYSPEVVLAEKGVAALAEVLPWNSSILLDHPDLPTGVPAIIRPECTKWVQPLLDIGDNGSLRWAVTWRGHWHEAWYDEAELKRQKGI